ncbi:hypothetical protein AB8O64_10990 [Streptomyces sp. QH1-20]|uniref:hypothetical protein n=1 Tax=Streptomyces sp. QH1-20 TaxID=3240934 RepID=UPI003511140C
MAQEELLPLEGWHNAEFHCRLVEVDPSDRPPALARVLLSILPPGYQGTAPRVEALADYISRIWELGASLDEADRETLGKAEQYRYPAEALMPWLTEAPRREAKDVFDRGYEAGRRRAAHASRPT